MIADACGVEVVVGPSEATAIGNALTQAIGNKDIKDLAELRDIVRRSFNLQTYEPRQFADQMAVTDEWEKQAERYAEICAQDIELNESI